MVTRVAPISARADLAATVAELNDLVVFGDLGDDLLAKLNGIVRSLVAEHDGVRRPPWWNDDSPSVSFNHRSPFSGDENPRAPQMRIAHPDGDTNRAIGEVNVPTAFSGPPGAVHGGILSGLFDEVVGWLAALVDPSAMIVTGRLSVRYLKPTPIRVPLEIHAEITKKSRLIVAVTAECRHADTVTATAEALMVVQR